MKTICTVSAILLGISTLSVLAQDGSGAQAGRPNPQEAFKQMDANADGKISREEASPRLLQHFDRLDITKDGFITLREFNAAQAGAAGGQKPLGDSPERLFKRMDTNGDGMISKEEAPPRLLQNFDRFDVTKDGFITLREFNAAQAGGQKPPGDSPERLFKRMDTNGDGMISKEEAPPRLLQNFDRFDVTKDGFITLREFNAARSTAPAQGSRPQ